ncbi:MAG: fibronectin type III domain-containing protein [Acidiferrobacterales bacterium]
MSTKRNRGYTSARILAMCILTTALAACGGGGSGGAASGSPIAPGSGSGTGNAVATGAYSLSWTPVNDSRVTGYKIYYSTAPFSASATVKTISVGQVASYTFEPSAENIASGTTVYLAIAAVGNGLSSPLSPEVPVTIH